MAVSSNLVRITGAEAADAAFWEVIGGGQADSQNTDSFVQGSESRARRIDAATRGFMIDKVTPIDLGAADTLVGWWVNCNQPAQIGATTNFAVRVGSNDIATSDWREWEVLTASTYPGTGGWQRVWVAINEITADNSAGSPNNASLRQFGIHVEMGNVGGNAPNVFCDAIDYLSGGGIALLLTGTGAFSDFVTADEGTDANRYGVVQTRGGVIYCLGRLGIGSATATTFSDSGFVLIFPDQQFVNADTMGLSVDLQNASTTASLSDGVIKSAGTVEGDLTVTGTAGSCTIDGVTLDNLRTVDLTSACTLKNSVLSNCGKLNQSGALLDNLTVRGAATADGEAFVVSGNPANIKNCSFVFSDGHAIEITAAGAYTFDGNSFTGYGTGNDAPIYNNSGGAVTLNVLNASSPAVRNGAGASTTVNNQRTLELTGLKTDSEVRIFDESDNSELAGTDSSGATFSWNFNLAPATSVRAFVFHVDYVEENVTGIVLDQGRSIPVQQRKDRVYANP